MDNIRRRIVGVMFPPSIFEDRCVDFRRSMIDVSTFKDRYVALRTVTICKLAINWLLSRDVIQNHWLVVFWLSDFRCLAANDF